MSPTVLQAGPYRFFFFASDRHEPPHVHVKRDARLAKFWLSPVRQAYKLWFPLIRAQSIAAIIQANEAALLRAWHDYFGIREGNNGGGKDSTGH